MAIRYFSRNDTLNYSPYNNGGILKKRNISYNAALNYSVDETLQQVVDFPEEKVKQATTVAKIQSKYYIIGQNNILLDAIYTPSGYNVIRRDDDQSEQIILFVTSSLKYKEQSVFTTNKVIYYLLMSEKYLLSASSTEQTLADSLQHTITHNFNGIVDYMLLDNTSSVVYDMPHQIIDNNKIKFTLPTSSTYELILWRIDDYNSNIYKNVFTTNYFNPNDVEWDIYKNIEQFDLTLNYRFSLIGYTVNHEQPLSYMNVKFDSSDQNNLSTIVNPALTGTSQLSTYTMTPNSNTINTNCSIERNFQYILTADNSKSQLLTNRLRVFLPNNEDYYGFKESCKDIYLYSSILSQTIYYDNSNKNKKFTIEHGLNGIVKVSLRNIANNLYNIKILDQSHVQIEFLYDYKVIPQNFYIDLFLIWSSDNNE